MRGLIAGCALAGMALTAGCSDEPERPECIDLPATCSPLFEPVTFDALFTTTLKPKCGDAQNCHGAARGGLVFVDADQSHALLLGTAGGKARVKPGDARCSELVVRTHDLGQDWTMPPGTALDAPERCAIRMWVDAGAVR